MEPRGHAADHRLSASDPMSWFRFRKLSQLMV